MYAKVDGTALVAFPYTEANLRRDNPNVSFPAALTDSIRASYQMVPVVPAAVPAGKISTDSTAALVGGTWTQVHTLIDAPTNSAIDTEALNAALVEEGSAFRGLALLLFTEINKLRVKTGDAAYTLAQFKAAFKAQMRT